MKKIGVLFMVLVMVLGLLSACGGSQQVTPSAEQTGASAAPAEQTSAPAPATTAAADTAYVKDKIVFAFPTATSLTPWGTRNSTPGNYEVYEMLFENDNAGKIYPILADGSKGSFMPGCDHEAGSGIYTIYIYPNIKDHAGNAVTASDVAFSYMHQFKEENTSGWDDLVNVEAVDPTTVKMTFKNEQSNLGQLGDKLTRCFIVSEASYKASPSKLVSDMCGTGPYMLKENGYVSGASVTLVRNDTYWQTDAKLRRQEQQANVKEIVYQFVDEASQQVLGLQSGTLDMVYNMTPDNAAQFDKGGQYNDKFSVYSYPSQFINYLDFNCSDKSKCGNVNLRLAIANAIDIQGIVAATGGFSKPLSAYATDYYSDYTMVDWASLKNYNTKASVDMAVVKQNLDAAKYDGSELKFACLMGDPVPEIIQGQLENAGIHVKLYPQDRAAMQSSMQDPSTWDFVTGMMAGDFVVQAWAHDFSWQNTKDRNRTQTFITDKEWEDLLNKCQTMEGHTKDNMLAWWQRAIDNAYTVALFSGDAYNIIPKDMTTVVLGDKKTILPGACVYTKP